jgi:hypothetical protein
MKRCYYLVLALLLLVISPVAADMYCERNNRMILVVGGTNYDREPS